MEKRAEAKAMLNRLLAVSALLQQAQPQPPVPTSRNTPPKTNTKKGGNHEPEA